MKLIVDEIIKAHKCCYLLGGKCTECPLLTNYPREGNCQITLAQETIRVLTELTELVNKDNPNYVEILDKYKKKNHELNGKLSKVLEILGSVIE